MAVVSSSKQRRIAGKKKQHVTRNDRTACTNLSTAIANVIDVYLFRRVYPLLTYNARIATDLRRQTFVLSFGIRP